MLDFIKKIVSSMKNKNSGPSIKKKKTPISATGRAIGFGMILAVVSIGIGVAIALINNPGQQPRPPVPGPNPPEPPKPPASPVLPPRELESYWDLRKESNCSSSEVKVPSGYATLICEISDRDMRNVFVFSWKSEQKAHKSNGGKDEIEHQVYFVPLNYRWGLGSNSKIEHAGGERKINIIAERLSSKDKARENFEHAMKGKTDVFFIGMASREGDLEIEEERAWWRARNLHEAFYAFIPAPESTNTYALNFGQYDDRKCPPLINSSEERPILIAMISGSGKNQQDPLSIYKNRIEPDLEEKVEQVIDGILKDIKKNNASGRKLVKPSCYSIGEQAIPIPLS
ncbi:MAG: hypothetical protein AB4352_22745 [Hormoscilla sp.]